MKIFRIRITPKRSGSATLLTRFINAPQEGGEQRPGHGGGLLVEAEQVLRVDALLEDLLEDGEDGGGLLAVAHPGGNQQEPLLGNVLLPVVELARRSVDVRQAVPLSPSETRAPDSLNVNKILGTGNDVPRIGRPGK